MAALAAEDGSGEPTMLLDMMKKELNGGIFENIPTLYAASQDALAAYAKLVFAAHVAGDRVASDILKTRAAQLRHQIECAAARYATGTHVILAGGLTRDREIVRSLLDMELRDPHASPHLWRLQLLRPYAWRAAAGLRREF